MTSKKNESSALNFFYNTKMGRIILKPVSSSGFSKICGRFLDSKLSKPLISSFVKKNNIDLSDFESDGFRCFNDCFCRKIKDGKRLIDNDDAAIISPCDGLLSAYHINDKTILPVKQSQYTILSLLQNDTLADKYKDGVCLVFRLCVNHYHRYCYPADGVKGENVFIKGKLHTVRPIALEAMPVFVENCREYTVIETEAFGDILQMEVGAMLVGKIQNHHGSKTDVTKGEEKGMFLYGGSTIILLLPKDCVNIKESLFVSTDQGLETPVTMGERLNAV